MHGQHVDLLRARARLTPQREALLELESGRRYSFADLNARACRAANFLSAAMGIRPGDRVALLAHNSVVYLDLLFAAARLGAIFAPLNWRLTVPELQYIIGDMEPRILLAGPGFEETVEALQAAGLDVPVVHIGDARSPDDYERALQRSSAAEPACPDIVPDTPLCLLYTSGTTGHPKGAILPHRQVLWNCINTTVSWGLRETDVTPVFTPLFHTGGLFAYLTPMLYAGGRVVLDRSFDAERSIRTILDERCTVILGVPTIYRLWLDCPAWQRADFSQVRHFNSGGAPCPPALMERVRAEKNVVFRQGYGLTEVGPNCFSMTDEESARITGSVGKPIFHSRMRLVNPDTDMDVPDGESGELWISGPHVCSGYWRKPEATAEVLTDGWFRTGDGAVRDAEGNYTISGRYKDMIKSGGENIYAAEVEAVVRQHPCVADAALIGQPDERWGEVGLLIVVRNDDAVCGEQVLLDFCDGRLARYKIPKRVVFAHTLPYSSYGKVLKSELRRLYLDQAAEVN